jgi:subtilisin family serine protease
VYEKDLVVSIEREDPTTFSLCWDFVELYVCTIQHFENDLVNPYWSIYDLDSSVKTVGTIESVGSCLVNSEWHLSRIQSRKGNYDQSYGYKSTFMNETNIYVVDTLVDVSHKEFAGRAFIGFTNVGNVVRNAHGTHVAALAGGSTVGVNRYANIISVAVLDDEGRGQYSSIIEGLEFISKSAPSKKNVIVNMSIGGTKNDVFQRVVEALIKQKIIIVVAAGNSNVDACTQHPSGIKGVTTVGSINQNTMQSSFSNYGPCVDIMAPGEYIKSAAPGNQYVYMSGTSMASPIVAGSISIYMAYGLSAKAALYLSSYDIIRGDMKGTFNSLIFVPGSEFCSSKRISVFDSLKWMI